MLAAALECGGRPTTRRSASAICPAGLRPRLGQRGIHLRTRLQEAKSGVLVLMGVRADGAKELIAMRDGYRESADSWAGVLRGCRQRGMHAPVLTVGDGALGFWQALAEVFSETRNQRCRVHKIANVLDSLPKSGQPRAKKAWRRSATPRTATTHA